jgi:biotin carboxyl carrier protein
MENQTINSSQPLCTAPSTVEPNSSSNVDSGPDVFSSDTLSRDLNSAIQSSDSFGTLQRNLADIVSQNSECLGLWFTGSEAETNSTKALIDRSEDVLGQLELASIELIAASAAQKQQLVFHPSNVSPNVQFVSCPILINQVLMGVLTGCFSTQNESPVRHHWLINLICHANASWGQGRLIDQSGSKISSLNDALALVQAIDATDSVDASGRAIVNHLRRLVDCEQVAFCHFDPKTKQPKLIAVSDVEQLDETTPVNRAIIAACRDTISRNSTSVFPKPDSAESLPELEQYCRASRLGSVTVIPLHNRDHETMGSILVAGEPQKLCQPKVTDYLQAVCDMISGHLAMALKANQGIAQRAKSSLFSSLKTNAARKAAIVLAGALLAMLIPLPYNVGCECQLEPVIRRFVAAPYDGILEQTFAENGQVVEANQLLARMDGRTLRIELSGVQAEFDAAKKRRDSALATGDVAQSHIARSEMKRHQSQMELLNRRLENLEVKSPIAGIIVSGDLEKAQGAPLETGQTLFEVGPLKEMVAEVQVPESEIRFVEAGQSVKIKLNAYPFQTFQGIVKHIHTRSEILTDQNVFVAEVIMENTNGKLKPGMAGSAKIKTGWSPLGWNLFHNAWEKARYWTIW